MNGSGTYGYIPMWNSSVSLNNSAIYQNGSYIGIGTTSPSQLLFVNGSLPSTIGNEIGVQTANSSSYSGLALLGDTANYGQITYGGTTYSGLAANNSLNIYQSAAYPIAFYTNGVQRMLINGSGYVGIGTASPQNKLNVVGDINATGNIYSNGALVGSSSSPGATNFNITNQYFNISNQTNSGVFFINGSNGNIGIGTTSPQSMLHIVSAPGSGVDFELDRYQLPATIIFRAAEGNVTNPTYSVLGDQLFAIGARGYGATGFSSAGRAAIAASASQNWTDAAQGTFLSLYTTANGTASEVERLRIDSNGNIGINTTSPQNMLNVVGDINGTGNLFVDNSALIWNATSNMLGVNTSTPQNTLNVVGTINATGNIYSNGVLVGSGGGMNGSGTYGYIPMWNSSVSLNNSAIYQNGSYIGIGTTSPNTQLDVNGSIAYKNNGGLRTYNTTGSIGNILFVGADNNMYLGDYNNIFKNNFSIYTAGNEVARITNTGLVGINTTNPTGLLQLNGNPDLILSRSGVNSSFQERLSTNTNGKSVLIISNTSSDTQGITIEETGNTGIGTTNPLYTLDVNGTVRTGNANTRGILYAIGNSSGVGAPVIQLGDLGVTGHTFNIYSGALANSFSVYDANTSTTDFIINGSGNVGINTTTPQNALNVIGDANITGSLWAANNSIQLFASGNDTRIGAHAQQNNSKVYLTLNPDNGSVSSRQWNIGVNSTGTNGQIFFADNGGYPSGARLVVGSGSNNAYVGIGTLTPVNALNVAGDINATGWIYSNGVNLSAGTAGGISGSGTFGYIPMWNSTSSINNSAIYQNATTNNIGIGTASPQGQLTIYSGGGNASLAIEATVNHQYWITQPFAADVLEIGGTGATMPLSAPLNINGSNVGIGTTTTSSLLTVAGTINSTTGSITSWQVGASNAGLSLVQNGTGGNPWALYSTGSGDANGAGHFGIYESGAAQTYRFFINGTNGRVGIGTTTPNALLTVNAPGGTIPLALTQNAPSSGTPTFASFTDTNGTIGNIGTYNSQGILLLAGNNGTAITAGTPGTGTLGLYVSNGTATSTVGNVGINTTTPVNTLNVIGDINATGNLFVDNSALIWNATSNMLGVNTSTPQNALNVKGDINATGSIYSNGINLSASIGGSTPGATNFNITNAYLNVSNQTTSGLFYVGANGNVGIGTTTPSATFDINSSASPFTNVRSNNLSGDVTSQWWINASGNSLDVNHPFAQLYAIGPSYAAGSYFGLNWANSTDLVFGGGSGAAIGTYTSGEPLILGTGNAVRINISGPSGTTALPTREMLPFLPAGIPAAGSGLNATTQISNNDPTYGMLLGTLNSGTGWIQQQRTDGTATAYNLLLEPNGGSVGIGTTNPGIF